MVEVVVPVDLCWAGFQQKDFTFQINHGWHQWVFQRDAICALMHLAPPRWVGYSGDYQNRRHGTAPLS